MTNPTIPKTNFNFSPIPPMTPQNVAVIGAGAAGLVAARELRREGHKVVVFERENKVGGTWVYNPSTESDPLGLDPTRVVIHSSLYASLRTNLPREVMGFRDYPFVAKNGAQRDPRRFPGHVEVLEYLNDFETEFELGELVRFGVEVRRVRLEGGKWKIRSRMSVGEELDEVYDAVVVCNGHYTEPRIAEIPGIETWPGLQIHSHNYRIPEPFQGQSQPSLETLKYQVMDTRLQELRRSEEALKQYKESTDNSIKELRELVIAMSTKYDLIAERTLPHGVDEAEHSNSHLGQGSQSYNSIHPRFTKIDFPKFQGEDPSGWVYKCERFFEFNHIEESQKVKLAAMHLDDKAIQWFQWFEKAQPRLNWKEFVTGIVARFGPNIFEDAIGELTKLTQITTVNAYQERFEELANRTSGLTQEFFVSCFLSGLREDIRAGVQMFAPTNITQAIGLARLKEESIEAMNRRSKIAGKSTNSWGAAPNLAMPKPFPNSGVRFDPKSLNTTVSNTNTNTHTLNPINQFSIKKLSQREMEARKEKGLCFNCDEKYVRGHRCQKRQLFLLIGDDEEDEELEQVPQDSLEEGIEEFQISMHAPMGCSSFRTMRVRGNLKGRTITILIDSGSTHNFIEPNIVKLSGFEVEPTPNLSVAVADGTKLSSKAVCKTFSWEMQGETFCTEVRVLPIGGCDMVLGVQWLITLGPILWDFRNLRMEFQLKGKSVVLQGDAQVRVEQVSPKKMQKSLLHANHGIIAQLSCLTMEHEEHEVVILIGSSASAVDICRDIAGVAKEVHIASRSVTDGTIGQLPGHDNMWLHSMIESAHGDGIVVFGDGSALCADVILHCTGYKYNFPFLDTNGTVTVDDNRVGPLFKHVFPPLFAPFLSFVGLPWKVVPFPLCELQSKWIAGVLSGRVSLPSSDEMTADVEAFYRTLDASGIPKRYTHNIGDSQFEYNDWLASECGCPPSEEWRKEMYSAASKNRKVRPETYRDEWDDEDLAAQAHEDFKRFSKGNRNLSQ